jgi:hypothetical protein
LALPPISGQPIPAARPIADPRAAAQRAFFQAALGRAQAPQPTAPTAAPTPMTRTQASAVAAPRAPIEAQAPDRSARPGSILNITV